MVHLSHRADARLAALRGVGRALARSLDERGVLGAAHAELARALDVTICFFGRYDAAAGTVSVIWQVHDGVELPGGTFPLGVGPTSQAIREAQPVLIRSWSRSGPAVSLQYATERPALPESSMVAPVPFDSRVIGVLSVQSYQAEAYDEDDVALLEAVAAQIALALALDSPVRSSDLEAIVASMDDAMLVLDTHGRVVRLNRAARSMLCIAEGGLILGQRLDQAQADHWPLGTRQISQQLAPVLEELERGGVFARDLELTLDGPSPRTVHCRASVVVKNEVPAGAVMVLRASD